MLQSQGDILMLYVTPSAFFHATLLLCTNQKKDNKKAYTKGFICICIKELKTIPQRYITYHTWSGTSWGYVRMSSQVYSLRLHK